MAIWTTIFAVVLGISLGLCGFTLIVPHVTKPADNALTFALVGLCGMVVGVVGLLIVALVAVIMAITGTFKR